MSIRVGRRIFKGAGTYTDSSYPGFKPIVVMTEKSAYGSISSFCITVHRKINGEDREINFENFWQFSKIYPKVPKVRQQKSRWDPKIIWEHPAEVHYQDGKPTEAYYRWKKKGFSVKEPIRYPVTNWKSRIDYRSHCICSYPTDLDGRTVTARPLDYVQARKQIYAKEYCNSVRNYAQFKELQDRLGRGENLLIIEVDGPHQESLPYYKEKYGVSDEFIVNDTVLVDEESMQILLNDTKHPFGHGYCLAIDLRNKHTEWIF